MSAPAEVGKPWPIRAEVPRSTKSFASGLLLDLLAALRSVAPGELVLLVSAEPSVAADLDVWARLTENSVVAREPATNGATRWIVRKGRAEAAAGDAPAVGSRLWLYTNFDCNLRCDYCCVRSSPTAARRELGLERVRRIASEAGALGVRELFVTGGEPLLLPDITEVLEACARAAPTTVLTNGMLIKGGRLDALKRLSRERLTLQISLDSPTPELHDLHRGAGTWERAWRGAKAARGEGFRVRLAATVSTDADAARFTAFLDREGVPPEDRVVRRVALRGFADAGVALARADVVPEITITAAGVYWHPVGAEDDDFLVTRDIFPLDAAFEAVREAWVRERALHDTIASVFHCA